MKKILTFKQHINEAVNTGKPAGLTAQETEEVATRLADAMSQVYDETFTVTKGVSEDSFDLDMDGEEFEGGSYNIYDDGSVINMAMRSNPNYGSYKSTVEEFVATIKEERSKLDSKWKGFMGDEN